MSTIDEDFLKSQGFPGSLDKALPPEALSSLKDSIKDRLCQQLLFSYVRKSVEHLPIDTQKSELSSMLTGFAGADLKEFQEKITFTAERIDGDADDPITKMMNSVIEKTLLKAVRTSITETVKEMVDQILEPPQ